MPHSSSSSSSDSTVAELSHSAPTELSEGRTAVTSHSSGSSSNSLTPREENSESVASAGCRADTFVAPRPISGSSPLSSDPHSVPHHPHSQYVETNVEDGDAHPGGGTAGAMTAAEATGDDDDDDAEAGQEAHIAMKRDWYTTAATFVAGGVAGAVSRTLTAPLDRIKIIVQEGHLVKMKPGRNLVPGKNPGILEVARIIRADGGLRGFWRGNLVNCFKAGPEFAIVFSIRRYWFSIYDDCIEREKERRSAAVARWKEHDKRSRAISERERVEREAMMGIIELDAESSTQPRRHAADGTISEEEMERLRAIEREVSIFTPPFNRFCCLSQIPRLMINCTIGAVAGVGAQSILYPMELIKTRLIVSKEKEYGGGVADVVRQAYRTGGMREFYKGFTPNLAGIIVYRGLEMGLYSSVQQSVMLYRMQALHLSRHDAALSSSEVGGVAMVASVVAQTVSYPLNVIRTRLQTQGTNGRKRLYTGMFDCFVKLVKRDGFPVLFSGLTANYLKSVPASGITFMVFEHVQQVLVGDD